MSASNLPELATAQDIATPMMDANEPAHPSEPHPPPPANAQADNTPAGDTRSAVERAVAYFVALGVGGETALTLTNTLDQRIDPSEDDSARRTELILEAFDRWTDELPALMGMNDEADRVSFTLANHLGRLLNQHPDALDLPDDFITAMKPLLEDHPHGILPNMPRQEMHRQPLGDLPSVLQGEFWSGTYRWVAPVGASTKRMLRGNKKSPAGTANSDTSEGNASGE
ncbi:MAG: hypothetical protein AAGA25_02595 [Planctomycetota bacterium]